MAARWEGAAVGQGRSSPARAYLCLLVVEGVEVAGVGDSVAELVLHLFELVGPLLPLGLAPVVLELPKLVLVELVKLLLPRCSSSSNTPGSSMIAPAAAAATRQPSVVRFGLGAGPL
jgi:hypothetical protein